MGCVTDGVNPKCKVLLHGCEWVADQCVESSTAVDDVTACVEEATGSTPAESWWSSWGRAIGLGSVAFPSLGALLTLLRRRCGRAGSAMASTRMVTAASSRQCAVDMLA